MQVSAALEISSSEQDMALMESRRLHLLTTAQFQCNTHKEDLLFTQQHNQYYQKHKYNLYSLAWALYEICYIFSDITSSSKPIRPPCFHIRYLARSLRVTIPTTCKIYSQLVPQVLHVNRIRKINSSLSSSYFHACTT